MTDPVDTLKKKLYSTTKKIAKSNDYSLYRSVTHAAAEKGCIPVLPAANELQIDIDSAEAFEYFKERFENLKQDLIDGDYTQLGIGINFSPISEGMWWESWPSASGLPNRHIIVRVPGKTFTDMERLVWQFALGSDPIREVMSFRRVLLGIDNPFVLFKPKEKFDVKHDS